MRIARFTAGGDPQFGVVTVDVDEHGIPVEYRGGEIPAPDQRRSYS